MTMEKTELKPCPFCGGTAEIKSGKAYYVDCFYTHCTMCGVSTPKIPVNHLFHTKGKDVRFTEEQAKARTANDWNRRVHNE
jgi:Lar family restriction alleviation protein